MSKNSLPKNVEFDFNSKIDSQKTLEKLVLGSYQKNINFFGKAKFNIKIKFLYQRSEMDDLCGYKTPEWHVGYANKDQIFIFSPSIFDKVSDHPKSDLKYTLIHEIAHIFTNEILLFNYPKWLHEGLAGYIAEQYKIRKVKSINDFADLHDREGWNKFHNYPQAYSFTKYLIDEFGKEKILKILKNLSLEIGKNHYFMDFKDFFNKFLKTDFDKLVLDWKKDLPKDNYKLE